MKDKVVQVALWRLPDLGPAGPGWPRFIVAKQQKAI